MKLSGNETRDFIATLNEMVIDVTQSAAPWRHVSTLSSWQGSTPDVSVTFNAEPRQFDRNSNQRILDYLLNAHQRYGHIRTAAICIRFG